MFSTILAMMLAAEPVDCAPKGSLERQETWHPGRVCKDEVPSPRPPTKPKPPFTPKPISAADKAEIIRQADIDLIDGPSARWRWEQPRLDADVYCSFVNSKNSMGGYVGWQPFYFAFGKLRIIGPNDSVIAFEALCSSSGYIQEPEWLKGK